ncbi:MAG: antibiotic biosynthesis monooxygenase family protein [Gaiellales bacterium]
MSMYVSLSQLRIAPERAPELIEAFRRRAGLVDAREGFIDLQVWQSDGDPGEIVMVSRWRDRACFKAYMRSADHRTSHDRIDGSLQAEIQLEALRHMRTFEVVAE